MEEKLYLAIAPLFSRTVSGLPILFPGTAVRGCCVGAIRYSTAKGFSVQPIKPWAPERYIPEQCFEFDGIIAFLFITFETTVIDIGVCSRNGI